MLRIAIVENENFAKDLIFEMQRVIQDEFAFFYFEKISQLVKSPRLKEYDIIILNEAYNNIRVTEALEFHKNNTLIIYCSEEGYDEYFSSMGRVFRIHKKKYKKDLQKIAEPLNDRLSKHKEYLISYNGLNVKLKYQDIIYIEKDDKNLIYHTKKGLFYERCSIAQKATELEEFDIIRINSGILVNYEYIFRIMQEEVELLDHTILPISRARRNYVSEFVKGKANMGK